MRYSINFGNCFSAPVVSYMWHHRSIFIGNLFAFHSRKRVDFHRKSHQYESRKCVLKGTREAGRSFMADSKYKAILIVSFGTTYPKTREKNISAIRQLVESAYPDWTVVEAFSSGIVRAAMKKKEGIEVFSPQEALASLKEQGYTHVAVFPTHVIDGIENHNLKQAVEECRTDFVQIEVADALLGKPQDYVYLAHLRDVTERFADEDEAKSGILYGIGVGPGEPELMTVKALQTIRSCDVIVIPAVSKEECYAYRIVHAVCPEIEEKSLICMPFPMIKDAQKLELAHEQSYQAIADYLKRGKCVGMLTIGDPSVYSTYMYMHHRAVDAGWKAYMISGVPSFCAAAGRLGISLGEKGEEIHVIPASYDVHRALDYGGTCIYMKSGKRLAELLTALREQEREGRKFQAYGVSNCGMENERVYEGLDELESAEEYLTTVIVKWVSCRKCDLEHEKEGARMEIKSILIKDTTREERIRIVQEGLNQCGGACDFCNGCDNLGGGSVDAFYEPYINGEKELRELNAEYTSNSGMVR